MKTIRLGLLIGSGSRLPPIYDFAKRLDSPVELSVVVSYKQESPKIAWARERGIPAYYHHWFRYKKEGKNRRDYNADLIKLLAKHSVNLVFGVGWDIIWTPNFLQAFPDRVLNAHPFPLPDEAVETIIYQEKILPVLRGRNALQRAWEMQLPFTGACVHFARETVDVGPVIVRDYLAIKPNEPLVELEKRHIEFEGRVLVEALQLVSDDRVRIQDEKVIILPAKTQKVQVIKKTILVIGSGGREHTFVWKLSQSKNVGKIYTAPGNAGTAEIAENVAIAASDVQALMLFALKNNIDLTIVGPEAPLALGIVDHFSGNGLRIFGPTQKAAQLETSKAWAVEFMDRHSIPHPRTAIFTDVNEAYHYVEKIHGDCVVKADGLTLGKGIMVCQNVSQAKTAIKRIMIDKEFQKAGDRGDTVIVQERLVGREISAMAFCDGKVAIPLVSVQDHKRVFDGDLGPNTGGMGAFVLSTLLRPRLSKKITRLLTLTVEAMAEEGIPYQGVLYGGLIIVDDEPYFLEYNCRFGDPETQVQLPLLESDLVEIMEACIDGKLTPDLVRFKNGASVCVVLVSDGYPGKYAIDKPISGLEELEGKKNIFAFHAGTTKKGNQIFTNGGRVLGITALDSTLEKARDRVYASIGNPITFAGMHYRKDIGAKKF